MDQRYVIEQSVQQRYVGTRDAKTFVPFLRPHLKPGMDVLDAGCGAVVAASVAAVTVGDATYFGVPRGTARGAGCPAPAY